MAILQKPRAWLQKFFQSGFRPSPITRWEWLVMRLLLSFLLIYNLVDDAPYRFTEQSNPRGIALLFDLTWLNESWGKTTIMSLAIIASVFYVIGRPFTVSVVVLTLLHTIVRTYHNSQGFYSHSSNIITLVLLAQAVVALVFRFRAWRGKPIQLPNGLVEQSYYLYYSQGIVAAVYVMAAISKIMRSSGMWVINSPYLALDLVKSHRKEYFRYLDPDYAGDPVLAFWVLEHPNISRLLFGSGFFLELFALLALKNRTWAILIGVALITFHQANSWLMHLKFRENQWCILIFLINFPFWIWWVFVKFKSHSDRPTLS